MPWLENAATRNRVATQRHAMLYEKVVNDNGTVFRDISETVKTFCEKSQKAVLTGDA